MAFSLRFLGYIAGGGALLAWLDPQPAPLRWAAILLWIVAAAYVDLIFHRAGSKTVRPRTVDGVIKMESFRSARRNPGANGNEKPERRTPRPIFSTVEQAQAEDLVALLRRKGLNPIMVTRRLAGDTGSVEFEVRLPERDMAKAKSLMSQYIARKSAPHN